MERCPDYEYDMLRERRAERERQKALDVIVWFKENEEEFKQWIDKSFEEECKKRNIKF